MIAGVGEIEALAEELFPAVLAVGGGRIGIRFGQARVARVQLLVLGIDAGRRRIENAEGIAPLAGFQQVQVDLRRVVHHVGVVLAGEDVTGAAHIGGQLIDLVEAAVDGFTAHGRVAQVADDEVIGHGFAEARILQVHAAHPKAFLFQSLNEVAPDEAARTADQCSTCHCQPPVR